MYIKYDTDQTSFGRRKESSWRNIGSFRPTWLVQTSDMQVVSGSHATSSGYCTLSYSWNCSGDIIQVAAGKSICDDKGLHQIVRHTWCSQQQARITTTTPVKFEKLIQQICKDFGIEYIWYDKLCIDQDDQEKRIEEIKQMHKIYKNARFTVVLLPELHPKRNIISPSSKATTATTSIIARSRFQQDPFDGFFLEAILQSQWCTRMWTLEEAVLSRDMVFVGETVHIWSHQLPELFYHGHSDAHQMYYPLVVDLCGDRTDAAKILHFAHRRTSTKQHDKVFALANIFANVITVDIDYNLNLREALLQFYSKLVKKDITILYFGKPAIEYPSTMRQFDYLPSWTGVAGMHVLELSLQKHLRGPVPDYTLTRSTRINMTCGVISIVPESVDQDSLMVVEYLELCFSIKVTHCLKNPETTAAHTTDDSDEVTDYHPTAFMSLTDEGVDYTKEKCQVLNIPFNVYRRHAIFHPVVCWDAKRLVYRSIGLFIIHILAPLASTHVSLDAFGSLEAKKFDIE